MKRCCLILALLAFLAPGCAGERGVSADAPVVVLTFPITNEAGTAVVIGEGLLLTADHVLPQRRGGIQLVRVGTEITEYEVVMSGQDGGQPITWDSGWEGADFAKWSQDWALIRIARPELASKAPAEIDFDASLQPGDRAALIGFVQDSHGASLRRIEGEVIAARAGLDIPGTFICVRTPTSRPYPVLSGGLVVRACGDVETSTAPWQMVGMYRGAFRLKTGMSTEWFAHLVRRPPVELKQVK